MEIHNAEPSGTQLPEDLLPSPDSWVSGLYFDEEGLCPAVIVAHASGQVFDIATFRHISLGLGPVSFLMEERLVWPVDSESVYHYTLIDESNLELSRTIPIEDIGEEGFWHDLSGDARDVAELFCPHFKALIPLDKCERELDEILEVSEEHFRASYSVLFDFETPDFW